MSEEAGHGVGSVVVEDEHRSDEGNVIESQEQGSPVLNHSVVLIAGNELPGGFNWVSEVGEDERAPMEESPVIGSQEDPISSPVGSFKSLYSSQSSEEGMKGTKMIPYVHPLKEIWVIQFEDTLLEVDCKSFNLIYESLLLEGKAGNLTDLTMGMVLAEKPPTWFPVIHS